MKKIKALAISGSLRKDSYNRKALQVAKKIAEDFGANISEIDLKKLDLPIYNGDIEAAGMPASVLELKNAIESHDVLLIASPEYNHSISGALKNALDWASRGETKSFKGKFVAIFGASPGLFGTVRGQAHVRDILEALGVLRIPSPHVFIKKAGEIFDEDGNLTDERTYTQLKMLIENTLTFAQKNLQ